MSNVLDTGLLADDVLPNDGHLLTYRLRAEEIRDGRRWETRVFGGPMHGDGWYHDSAEAAIEWHQGYLADRTL